MVVFQIALSVAINTKLSVGRARLSTPGFFRNMVVQDGSKVETRLYWSMDIIICINKTRSEDKKSQWPPHRASGSLLFAAATVALCLDFVSIHHIAGDLLCAAPARITLRCNYCCFLVVVIDQMMQRPPLLGACEHRHWFGEIIVVLLSVLLGCGGELEVQCCQVTGRHSWVPEFSFLLRVGALRRGLADESIWNRNWIFFFQSRWFFFS